MSVGLEKAKKKTKTKKLKAKSVSDNVKSLRQKKKRGLFHFLLL